MLSLALILAFTAAQQDQVQFLPSLAAAVSETQNGSASKRPTEKHPKIVIYSSNPVALRDNLAWMELERLLWTSAAQRQLMAGVPLVAMDSRTSKHKALDLPSAGFTVLSADGKTVLQRITILDRKLPQVISELSRALGKDTPTEGMPKGPAPAGLTRKLLRFEQYLKGGKTKEAERFCKELEAEDPRHAWPPLLRRQIRERTASETWFAKLPKSRPIEDRIVVVPDSETFRSVLATWGVGPIFPILFHDTSYLPKFAKAFGAAEIVYLPKTRTRKQKKAAERSPQQLLALWAQATGLKPPSTSGTFSTTEGLALWKGIEDRNPGLVVVDPNSAITCAGLALAAGRKQGLVFANACKDPSVRIGIPELSSWQKTLRSPLEQAKIKAFDLYDDIDFVTLALPTPYRYADAFAADKTSYAVDDAICRDSSGLRWAYTGRLCGTEVQSTYAAMCALFLKPKNALLFSRYSEGGIWGEYGLDEAEQLLSQRQKVTSVDHPTATRSRWRELQAQSNSFDYVHINSSGGQRDWSTSGKKAGFDDVPASVPAIVTLTHSTSLGNPYDLDTIAGRWVHHGAYAYFGSIHEPYLDAFVPIGEVMDRMIEGHQPLGAALRHRVGTRRWRSWKLMQIGDPLLRFDRGLPTRLAPSPRFAKAVPLAQAERRNPWRLATAEKQIFGWQCRVIGLQIRPQPKQEKALRIAIGRYLKKMDKRPKKYSKSLRQSLANTLPAIFTLGMELETARAWTGTETLRSIENRALDLAIHAFCRRHLLSKESLAISYDQVEALALTHASRTWTDQQAKVIKTLWTDYFAQRPKSKTEKQVLKPRLKDAITRVFGAKATKFIEQ